MPSDAQQCAAGTCGFFRTISTPQKQCFRSRLKSAVARRSVAEAKHFRIDCAAMQPLDLGCTLRQHRALNRA
ncbi:MAG: hypothetical protein EOP82_25880 [Variovorax sp.]|nr:MAG: hypothetical protein EOP82_25880 [Variovorax sp.]